MSRSLAEKKKEQLVTKERELLSALENGDTINKCGAGSDKSSIRLLYMSLNFVSKDCNFVAPPILLN